MINVALASYGMSGHVFHAPLLSVHSNFRFHSVLERNRSDSQERYPEVKLVRQYEELLTDDSVEVIVVNTPNPYHYDMAEAALRAGKHVVVEKPFTNTAKEGEQLIALAEEKGRVLTVFQNRRWDSDFLTVQKVLAANVLGQVVEYEAHYDRFRNYIQPDTWKEDDGPGSGILYNLGSHMIDQALVLFGLPQTLFARLSIQRAGGKAPDAYHLILGYETMQVVLKSSYLVRDQGPRYKLLGSQGTFTKYGLDPQEDLLKLGVSPDNSRIGQEPETDWGTLDTEFNGLSFRGTVASEAGDYTRFYDNLYQALQGKETLAVPAEEALSVIRLIELAYQSNESGREVSVN
jgi:predicted dehydrogenase